MQNLDHSSISMPAQVERRAPAETAKATARSLGAWAAVVRLLRSWRDRELQRRELSTMSARDFGDLAVPRSLASEEMRRWPWQKSSEQWSQIINTPAAAAATAELDKAETGSRYRGTGSHG